MEDFLFVRSWHCLFFASFSSFSSFFLGCNIFYIGPHGLQIVQLTFRDCLSSWCSSDYRLDSKNVSSRILGVPTFKDFLSHWAGWYIFSVTFHEDSNNVFFFKIRHTQSTHNFCLACLLSFDEQPSWAELVRRLGVSNLEKNYIFGILMKSWTKFVSPNQIRRNFFSKWALLIVP